MAYFDTDKTAGTTKDAAFDARTAFYRLVKSVSAALSRLTTHTSKSPEDLLAAQHRAEAARRKVDHLLR